MREGWKYKKLGEVVKILDSQRKPVTKKNRTKGIYPYYGATGIQDYIDKYIFDGRYVLVGEDGAKWAAFDKSAFIIEGKTWVNNHAHVLQPCDFLIDSYLTFFLNYSDLDCYISGAIVRKLTQASLRNIDIPIPPKSTQLTIVSELDQINDLIRLKQEQLKEYDNLAQSIFYDMFGDPVENEKGWDVKKLCDVCTKITDGTHDTPKRLTSGVKFITGKHIRPFHIDYDNSDYVTEEVHREIYKRCNPEYSDVLYTNIGANFATAAVNIVTYEFSMKNVALLKFDNDITGFYVQYVLNFESMHNKIVENFGKGGAQNFLSLKQINSIYIPLPPLPLQQEFSSRIEQIEKLKAEVQKTITDLETLLASRMQYWFE